MKTLEVRGAGAYKMLMLVASRIHQAGYRGVKAHSDKYEILVTIKVKENKK